MKSADKDAVRAYCANSLIDRGWGKPNQPVTGAEGKAIEILVRTIVDGKG